jgi:serine/threonine protein kinase
VRWMAPESIREHKYSTKTDVFSFGVLLWELMTDGEVPHGDQPLREVAIARRDNCTVPEIPADAPEILAKVARKCWAPTPDDRPAFKKIVNMLATYVAENFEEDSDLEPNSPRFGKLSTLEASNFRGTSASGALLSGSVATIPNESKAQLTTSNE